MQIIDIYKKYHIPQQLQLHMLRVAACSNLILDNFEGKKINKESIIRVCLLHDMGNIAKIKDNPDNDNEFINIRNRYISEFGLDDHQISLAIGKELGLSDYELQIHLKLRYVLIVMKEFLLPVLKVYKNDWKMPKQDTKGQHQYGEMKRKQII